MSLKERLLQDMRNSLEENKEKSGVEIGNLKITLPDLIKEVENETALGKIMIAQLEQSEAKEKLKEELIKKKHEFRVRPDWWPKIEGTTQFDYFLQAMRAAGATAYLQEQGEENIDEFIRWINQADGWHGKTIILERIGDEEITQVVEAPEMELTNSCGYKLDYILRKLGLWGNEEEKNQETTGESQEDSSEAD